MRRLNEDSENAMKALILPRYDCLAASTRLRFIQYFPWLEKAEIQTYVFPFFSNDYVYNLQFRKKKITSILTSYLKRLRDLLNAHHFDFILIHIELLPWLPAWVELYFLSRQVCYVLDYDDAFFHRYDQHRSALVRKILGSKHDELIRRAVLVIAGNEYIAKKALTAGAKRVEIVPTVIDLNRYPPPDEKRIELDRKLRIGWIGQCATVPHLLMLKNLMVLMAQEHKVIFSAIGIDAAKFDLPMQSVRWTEETEVEEISRFDIGIMPLPDTPFERGKCGYKLIQYMACGLPVIASPVGANCKIVEHGVNGFLAETEQEWRDALLILISDPELRYRMGLAGRQKIEKHYSIQVTGPKMATLLSSLVTKEHNILI